MASKRIHAPFYGDYVKVVAPTGQVLVLIYGRCSNPTEQRFIQLATSSGLFKHWTFDRESTNFAAKNSALEAEGISIQPYSVFIHREEINLQIGMSSLMPEHPSRSVMGANRHVPFLPCYLDVAHANQPGSAQLTWGDGSVNLENATVYRERCWGDSFPTDYCWAHLNDEGNQVEMMLSLASLSVAGMRYSTFIGFIRTGNELEFFGKYNRSSCRYTPKGVIELSTPSHRISIEVNALQPVRFAAPRKGAMTHTITQYLNTEATMNLAKKRENQTQSFRLKGCFEAEGSYAFLANSGRPNSSNSSDSPSN